MSAKNPKKTQVKSISKKTKPLIKSDNNTKSFLAHWLQDVSLEITQPPVNYSPGERMLEFSVQVSQVPILHPEHGKIEMRLKAHISVQGDPIVLAETIYSAVINKAQSEQDLNKLGEELYPIAKKSLEDILGLAGHKPVLPESLQSNS